MPFTVKDFPDMTFNSIEEYKEAVVRRELAEKRINAKISEVAKATQVTATIIPLPRDLLERRISNLEHQVKIQASMIKELIALLQKGDPDEVNFEGVPLGLILHGVTRGQSFTLEPLKSGYLCSDGRIYQSLSGAALGVSGNRRSGWTFWKDGEGRTIGETTGRHEKREPDEVPGMSVGKSVYI